MRSVLTVLMIALLRSSAAGNPTPDDTTPHDPDGAPRASDPENPWLDQAQQPALEIRTEPVRHHKLAASLTLAGLYAGFIGWTYLAWYRRPTHEFRWSDPKTEGDWRIWTEGGWFGKNGYAGGADKMGHAWATLGLARAGTEMLYQWGGYDRLTSAIWGTVLSEALFLGVEIRDGFSYVFSQGDFVFNTLGASLAFAQSMWPSIDEAVDFRVAYFPSKAYRDQFRESSDLDVAEDYSGQTYHLAFHLGAIDRLAEWKYGSWSKFVDLTIGFESRGYKPDPLMKPNLELCMAGDPTRCDFDKERNIFIGLTLNAQGLFDWALHKRSKAGRKITHGLFEVFSIPYTTFRVAEHTAVPTGVVPDEQ